METDRGVTKHMYVMEPDVPGGSGLFYSKLSHTSMLGVAHVMGKCKVGSDDAIDASVVDNYYNVDENNGLNDKKMLKMAVFLWTYMGVQIYTCSGLYMVVQHFTMLYSMV